METEKRHEEMSRGGQDEPDRVGEICYGTNSSEGYDGQDWGGKEAGIEKKPGSFCQRQKIRYLGLSSDNLREIERSERAGLFGTAFNLAE